MISAVYFAACTVVGLAAFLGIGGMIAKMVLFIVFWLVNAGFIFIYLTSQVVLVLIALDDRWSLGMECLRGSRSYLSC